VGAHERAAADASVIRERTGVDTHDVAVVLGSGWAPAAEHLGLPAASVAMGDLPGFPAPTVAGHEGVVRSVDVGGRRALVLVGRSHLYEGTGADAVVHGVRTAVAAGCSVVVLTNAAGGVDPALAVGRPVLIADHLNLTGHNPLVGPPPPSGPRFVDLSDCWSARLRGIARDVDPTLREGVYAAFLGLSLVTNPAAGVVAAPIDHADVLARGQAAADDLGRLLAAVVSASGPAAPSEAAAPS
jgi:purine-nucleoside phosphorylase